MANVQEHAEPPQQPRRNRRSVRLTGYDYSQGGAYFVTVCTQNRECWFGAIVDDRMHLNDTGQMVQTVWNELPIRFPHMALDEFVIMPNHIHGIIALYHARPMGTDESRVPTRRGESCIRPDCTAESNHRRGESCIRPMGTDDHTERETGDHDDRETNGHGNPTAGDHKDRPYGTLAGTVGRIVQAFKSITTHEYICGVRQSGWPPFDGRLWQRNYYEHIIRDGDAFDRIQEYIITNPRQWEMDRHNPVYPTP